MPSLPSGPSNRKMNYRAETERLLVSEQRTLIDMEKLKGSLAVAELLAIDLAAALAASKTRTGVLECDNGILQTRIDVESQRADDVPGTHGDILFIGLLKMALDAVNRKNALRVELLAELREVQQRLAASVVKVIALEERVADGECTIAYLQMQLDSEQAYCYFNDDDVDAQCAAIWSGAGCHNSDDADDSTYDFAAMLAAARVTLAMKSRI